MKRLDLPSGLIRPEDYSVIDGKQQYDLKCGDWWYSYNDSCWYNYKTDYRYVPYTGNVYDNNYNLVYTISVVDSIKLFFRDIISPPTTVDIMRYEPKSEVYTPVQIMGGLGWRFLNFLGLVKEPYVPPTDTTPRG